MPFLYNPITNVLDVSADVNGDVVSTLAGTTNEIAVSAATGDVVLSIPNGLKSTPSGISTTPVASSVATTAFGSSLTGGTATQNTTGYDLLLNVTVNITSAVTGNITLGIGPTNTPTANTVLATSSLSTTEQFTFAAYVPNNYYVLVNSTGLTVISSIQIQAMAV